MALNRKKFDECILFLEENHPSLNIIIYEDSQFTPEGASGSYMDGRMEVAIGPNPKTGKTDWTWIISTVAHEYSHYRRELVAPASYNNAVCDANSSLYGEDIPHSERAEAAVLVMRDEYETDQDCYYNVLPEWGLVDDFKSFQWFKQTNLYNYKIKFYLDTGVLYSDRKGKVKAPNRQFSKKEVVSPLSYYKKREISKLLDKKIIVPIIIGYSTVLEENF